MASTISSKRTLIDKSNSTIVVIAGIAAFIVVFCLVASKSLISQELYQGRVIAKKKVALNQLKTDVTATSKLVSSYQAFISPPTNLLGGNPNGNGPQDGSNYKIVLDALPSVYDFPALATSLGNLITSQGLTDQGITGMDSEVTQQTVVASGNPQPTPMPFTINVQGSYAQVQQLISLFELSIRPFQIQSIDLTGAQNNITASIDAQTYYQAGKTVNITKETIK